MDLDLDLDLDGDSDGEEDDVRLIAPWWTGHLDVVPGFNHEREAEAEGSRVGEWWRSAGGGGLLGCVSYGRSFSTWLR